jgi:hypothetical protein
LGLGVSIYKSHRDPSNLPYNFGAARKRKSLNTARGKRVRYQHELSAMNFAPSASVTITEFHKIYGSVELGSPVRGLHFSDMGINLDE